MLQYSLFIPTCVDGMKPAVGMSFDSIRDMEELYKKYAHEGGFSVRIGSQNMLFGEIVNKRFFCSKNGFKKKNVTPRVTTVNHALGSLVNQMPIE
jgi:hypothetical protein